ncbi:MAG: dTDP-4-dehydrorhamnose 3,5-epimerase [Chloroflexaceae bacterium]|nr:dTDP-4-dehydrorhamnose 3,5-epimerase [Chloroflexaceae bacterium]
MQFTETQLQGAFIIDLDRKADDRGFFARTYCRAEFATHGIEPRIVQCNLSYNHQAGTLRGLHYQVEPSQEAKLIRCVAGAIYDVIVDWRQTSPTYSQHIGVELTAENRRALFVPPLFAHGYQALSDGAEVLYQVSEFYTPGCERGLRYDDPALGIKWPLPVSCISAKDANWPLLPSKALEPALTV